MRFLILVVVAGTIVRALASPQLRRQVRALLRSAAVLTDLRAADYGQLQLQVLLAARRTRTVTLTGRVRLPSHFQVTFAAADQAIVEPVERELLAEVAEVLADEAVAHDWHVARPIHIAARYADGGRPGFPRVVAVDPAEALPPVTPHRRPSAPHDDGRTQLAPSSVRLVERQTSRVVELDASGDRIEVGRRRSCGVPVSHPTVSGHHARLERGPRGWTIVDAGSRNGTFVNGEPATTPVVLREGDVVGIGPCISYLVGR